MEIRQAHSGDAEGIAYVHIEAWKYAYNGIIPDQVLSALDIKNKTRTWAALIQQKDAPTYVATDIEGSIRGFVNLCGYRGEAFTEEPVGEIAALYITPSLVGTGLGASLFSSAIEHLSEAGYKTIALWVLQQNKRAIAFYETFGFNADGTEKTHGGSGLTELRYTFTPSNA